MLTDQEFEALLSDGDKLIFGDIAWQLDRSHSPAQRFRCKVDSEADWPLMIEGWWNPDSEKLTYTLIHRQARRIIGLDLGEDLIHHNPTCERKRGKRTACECPRGTHKHRWTEQFKAEFAYVPLDITAPWHEPIAVWREFCLEVGLTHMGILQEPVWLEERWQ